MRRISHSTLVSPADTAMSTEHDVSPADAVMFTEKEVIPVDTTTSMQVDETSVKAVEAENPSAEATTSTADMPAGSRDADTPMEG